MPVHSFGYGTSNAPPVKNEVKQPVKQPVQKVPAPGRGPNVRPSIVRPPV
jgi:hypothetical protein